MEFLATEMEAYRTHKPGKCNYRRDNNLMQGELDQHLFSNWTRLEYLELHKNDFTGVIPSEIGLLTNLIRVSSDKQSSYPSIFWKPE
ncbi:hypothetical protein Patl1_09808 [Pistacia atlantica]|uniref:Uncharacterized protein n=1 Tax=Pistacia atlantica TaxID=434234 RepID=A0ACC1A8W9_9ROSI|nr:hypothetical protein Patl1_09808 [Pistacia atlantica]